MSKIILISKNRIIQVFFGMILFFLGLGLFQSSLTGSNNQILATLVANTKLKPIYYVDTEDKKIAISFDATWGAEYTPKILDILEENNLKTTFFLTNIWLKQYPEMAQTIRFKGHEIAMHSVTHPHLNSLSEAQILEELQGNAKMIEEITEFTPMLFRPPFGEYNNKVIQVILDAGYIPIQWSVDSLDWKENMTKDDIYNRVTGSIHPGAIVLFHNNGTYTADALHEIIQFAFAQGYQIIPVSELIYKENYYINIQGAQIQKKTR